MGKDITKRFLINPIFVVCGSLAMISSVPAWMNFKYDQEKRITIDIENTYWYNYALCGSQIVAGFGSIILGYKRIEEMKPQKENPEEV